MINRNTGQELGGLPFYRSKDYGGTDQNGTIAEWGTSVKGYNEGDGWIKTMARGVSLYLSQPFDGLPCICLTKKKQLGDDQETVEFPS